MLDKLGSKSGEKTSGKQSGSNLLITALVLVLIIVFTFMLTDYFKQHRLQDNLRNRINQGRQELESINSPSTDLLKQLEEIKRENQAVKASLATGAVNTTAIIAGLLKTAAACELTSSNLSTDKWQKENIGDSAYNLMPVRLELKGTISGLSSFLTRLENKTDFPSLAIKELSVSGPEAGTAPKTGRDATPAVSARMTVMIMTRIESKTGEH